MATVEAIAVGHKSDTVSPQELDADGADTDYRHYAAGPSLPPMCYRPSPSNTFSRARTDCSVARGTEQSFVALRALLSIVRS